MCLRFNPKYDFDSYITGESNLAAYKIVLAIAGSPAKAFNPLYLYGPTGVGKTHLFHCIGNYVAEMHPGTNISFLSCELVTEVLIAELRNSGDNESFANLFQSTDILMIEDIQFLYGKHRAQEVLSYVFKTLIAAGKQIVLSSSCPPHKLPALDFKKIPNPTIIRIKNFDKKTRLSFLKNKVREKQVVICDDLLTSIADKFNCAFELEGIINRIRAITTLKNLPVTPAVVDEAVRPIVKVRRKNQ